MRARPAAGARSLAAVALGAALAAAGCTYFQSITEIGGPRILPADGRAVRRPDGAAVYLVLRSQGQFGDIITGVSTAVARQARLVDAAGAPLARFEVPPAAEVAFTADGPHVVLTDLTRPLVPGESIIVTLTFQKSGGIGVISVVQ